MKEAGPLSLGASSGLCNNSVSGLQPDRAETRRPRCPPAVARAWHMRGREAAGAHPGTGSRQLRARCGEQQGWGLGARVPGCSTRGAVHETPQLHCGGLATAVTCGGSMAPAWRPAPLARLSAAASRNRAVTSQTGAEGQTGGEGGRGHGLRQPEHPRAARILASPCRAAGSRSAPWGKQAEGGWRQAGAPGPSVCALVALLAVRCVSGGGAVSRAVLALHSAPGCALEAVPPPCQNPAWVRAASAARGPGAASAPANVSLGFSAALTSVSA